MTGGNTSKRAALTRQPIDDTFLAELADRVIQAVRSCIINKV